MVWSHERVKRLKDLVAKWNMNYRIFTSGDLGNVEASADGVAALDIKDSLFSLSGDRSIIGEWKLKPQNGSGTQAF